MWTKEGQHLADEQPADDRNPERAAQFGALAEADRERHCPSIAAILDMTIVNV